MAEPAGIAVAIQESQTPSVDPEKLEEPEKVETVTGPVVAEEFVEGGLKGWIAILCCWMTLSVTFGQISSFGVYQSKYITIFSDQSPSTIAWIGSVQLFLCSFVGSISGPLFDGGHFRITWICGSVLFLFSLFMTSLATKFWQAMLAQSFGMGIGMGLVYVPSVALLSHYFRAKRGLANGMAVSGSSAGGVFLPIMLNRLIPKIGFEKSIQASGYLSMGFLAIAYLGLQPKYPKNTTGLPPPKYHIIPDPRFLKEAHYSLMVAGCCLTSFGLFVPIFYIESFAQAHNLAIAPNILAILNGTSILGRLGPTALSDYLGCFNMLIVVMCTTSVLAFAMFGATTTAGCIVFAALYGLSSGGYFALITPTMITLAKHPGEIGARLGLAYSIGAIGLVLGAPIAGAILSACGGRYFGVIIYSGCSIGVGLVLSVLARHYQVRWKGTWRV